MAVESLDFRHESRELVDASINLHSETSQKVYPLWGS